MPTQTQYVLRCGADVLNRRFYQGYDPGFLYHKAKALMYISTEQESFQKQIEQSEEFGADIEQNFFEALRAELHFTAIHQLEGFFALAIALYQGLPHWLYLTEYPTREIKAAIQQFLSGDIATLTQGKQTTLHGFIQDTIYGSFLPGEEGHIEQWNQNLDNISWLVEQMGKHYLDAIEYNGYKHGLRVMVGPSFFTARLNDAEGQPIGPTYTLGASEDSVPFLELKDMGEGGKTVCETTKHFSPKLSFFYIEQMYQMLTTIKNTRQAQLTGETTATIYVFLDLDKDQVRRQRKNTRWTLTI